MAKQRKRTGKKVVKRDVRQGIAHIQSTFNNTIVTITDMQGNTLSWSSSGVSGQKGSRKSTPFAAQLVAKNAATKAMEYGLKYVEVFVKGPGSGKRVLLYGLFKLPGWKSRRFEMLRLSRITDVDLQNVDVCNVIEKQ